MGQYQMGGTLTGEKEMTIFVLKCVLIVLGAFIASASTLDTIIRLVRGLTLKGTNVVINATGWTMLAAGIFLL